MKKIVLLIIALSVNFCNHNLIAQVKSDTLKNKTIITMTKSKLGDKIILSKINTSPCRFDVDTDALILLKQSGVSDTVMNLMVYKQSLLEAISDNNAAQNSDGGNFNFKESGIYFKRKNEYIPLDPTLVTSSQASGFASIKYKSQLEGNEANYQLAQPAEFYFNFAPAKKELNSSNANSTSQENYFQAIMSQYGLVNKNAQAVSPNEFKLVKLDVKKNKREYMTGKISMAGRTDFSIDDKYLVNFKYEKLSGNTYKVIVPAGLKPGEYCFVYLSQSGNPYMQMAGQNSTKVFDFGIK